MLDADSGLNIIDDSHNHRFPSCGIQLLIVLGRTKELLEIKNKKRVVFTTDYYSIFYR